MTVTKLQEIQKNKIRVYLDDTFAFVLYKGEVSSYHLREDAPVSEETMVEIRELLKKRATLRAMNLLKARPYTVKGLTGKLQDGEYPEEAVKAALSYVKGYGYLDDLQYARDYINTYRDRKNLARLKADLAGKGVPKDLVEEALEEELGDEEKSFEEEQIRRELRKKGFDPENTSYEEKQKIFASLYRKGYSADLIRKVCVDHPSQRRQNTR